MVQPLEDRITREISLVQRTCEQRVGELTLATASMHDRLVANLRAHEQRIVVALDQLTERLETHEQRLEESTVSAASTQGGNKEGSKRLTDHQIEESATGAAIPQEALQKVTGRLEAQERRLNEWMDRIGERLGAWDRRFEECVREAAQTQDELNHRMEHIQNEVITRAVTRQEFSKLLLRFQERLSSLDEYLQLEGSARDCAHQHLAQRVADIEATQKVQRVSDVFGEAVSNVSTQHGMSEEAQQLFEEFATAVGAQALECKAAGLDGHPNKLVGFFEQLTERLNKQEQRLEQSTANGAIKRLTERLHAQEQRLEQWIMSAACTQGGSNETLEQLMDCLVVQQNRPPGTASTQDALMPLGGFSCAQQQWLNEALKRLAERLHSRLAGSHDESRRACYNLHHQLGELSQRCARIEHTAGQSRGGGHALLSDSRAPGSGALLAVAHSSCLWCAACGAPCTRGNFCGICGRPHGSKNCASLAPNRHVHFSG